MGNTIWGLFYIRVQLCAAVLRNRAAGEPEGAKLASVSMARACAADAQNSPLHSWVYVRQYCVEIDEAARNRMELIVRSLAEQNGVTEQLKAENQMEWVRQMNACKAQAEEVVKMELIYN